MSTAQSPNQPRQPRAAAARLAPRRRIVTHERPPVGVVRRIARAIFSPPVLIALGLLVTLSVGVFGYYYSVFSERIDRMLRGEVFTRSAGIYAQPKMLHTGDSMTPDALVARLKRIGYVEQDQQADASRGRYAVTNAGVEIEPSENSNVDGQMSFPAMTVAFARGKNEIAGMKEKGTSRAFQSALLEPEQISSVTGADREKRKVVGFNDLPAHLVKAITVTEDRAFFEHNGINLRGIVRALLRRYDNETAENLRSQGGSSITQQLVKNLLLTNEKTLSRKVAEAYMSVILETRLSKEEIFALYCNEVYLGQHSGYSVNGFGQAAEAYFNKDVNSLTLPESAFLAGIIRSPNRYNPYRARETALERRNQVLDSMTEAKAINAAERDQAQRAELRLAPARGRLDQTEAPYFLDHVQGELGELLADADAAQHLRIYTTLDMDLQRAAYDAVTRNLRGLDKLFAKRKDGKLPQASLVAMNAETGEVIAMVGGRDYEKSSFNRATDAMRQPGSVFKPFVYAAALNTAFDRVPRLITPATVFRDEAKAFTFDNAEYKPNNFGNTFSNAEVTLRDALVRSLNVVTVEVAMDVTIGRVMNLAAKAGLPRPSRAYPAMALGTSEATPLQIASAYTAFAAEGKRATPISINRITTGEGRTVVAPTTVRNEVLRPEVAYVMTSMMRDVVERGTAARLRAGGFRHIVAGKTGTSRDAWFAGYTPKIVCAVYVGFDDGAELNITGADAALPIWRDFMNVALASHPEWTGDWKMPAGIEQAVIDPTTGALATELSPARRTELFIANTAPLEAIQPETVEYAEGELPTEEDPAITPSLPATQLPASDDLELPPPTAAAPPPPRPRAAPRLEGRGELQPDGTRRLVGTVTLTVDSTTGLIAARGCPVARSQTFPIGSEPKRYCSPAYHNGRTATPAGR